MKITIDKEIQDRLATFSEAKLVLDFDHSLSQENVGTDCCGVTRYRLVAVDKVPAAFDEQIPSNVGPIYYQSWGNMYLDQNMYIRPAVGRLIQLTSDSGQIEANMEIVDYR